MVAIGTESVAGFEPACKCCIHKGSGATDSQIDSQSFRDHPEVAEIAAAWDDLPDALKAAVLGIVRSAAGCVPKRTAESDVPPEPPGMRGGVSPSLLPPSGARPSRGEVVGDRHSKDRLGKARSRKRGTRSKSASVKP
jgi:hypothetical protein